MPLHDLGSAQRSTIRQADAVTPQARAKRTVCGAGSAFALATVSRQC
jgi:hypothetical protein